VTSFVAFEPSFQSDAFQEYSDNTETHAGESVAVVLGQNTVFVVMAVDSRIATSRERTEYVDGD
jgi:hypothetical protein